MTDADDKLRYSAAGLRACAAPPGAGRPVQVRDVLLVTIGYADGDIDLGDEFGRHPPAGLPYRDVSGPVPQRRLAKSLGISDVSLRRWIGAARVASGEDSVGSAGRLGGGSRPLVRAHSPR
jgi:hypothetical protein